MAKIMLDPGHGGKDPGAIGARSKEAHNVLKVANVVKSILEKNGHTVRLTRSDNNTYLSLGERATMANNWGADIFVSLHDNSASNKAASGFETFIFNGTVSNNTVRLQNELHKAVLPSMGIRDRGKKRANFGVLRMSKMPAVLFEYAFISNAGDEKILIEEFEKHGAATAKGIANYFNTKIMDNTVTTKPSTPPTPTIQSINVGDLVKIKASAKKYANVNKEIPQWAKNSLYTVEKTDKENALLKEIKSYVRLSDLSIEKTGGGAPVKPKPTTPKPQATPISRALRYGHSGNDVLELQKLLVKANFYPNIKAKNNGVDGHFGKDTQNAVRRFQSVYLPREVDGVAGTRTITKLRSVAK